MARIKQKAGREEQRRQKWPAGLCPSFTQQILAEHLLCATIVLQTEESVIGQADLVSVLRRPPGSWESLRSESTILMGDTYCDGGKDWGCKKWGSSGEHPEKGTCTGAHYNLQYGSENQPGSRSATTCSPKKCAGQETGRGTDDRAIEMQLYLSCESSCGF